MAEQKIKFKGINPKDEIATRARAWDYANFFPFLPDPDHVLELQGEGIAAYNRLLSDSHLGSCILSRKAGAAGKEWKLDKCDTTARFYKIILKMLEGFDLDQIAGEILEAPLYGYSPIEISWERRDGLLLPVDLRGKPPAWFIFNKDNELLFRTRTKYQGEPVPPWKFLLPRHDATYANPYGQKLLSRCFWPVTFKKAGLSYWAVFLEKFGMPFVVGRYPRGTDETQVNELVAMLERMVKDAVAAVPEGNQVELIQAGSGSGKQSYGEFIVAVNAEVSKAILGQTLTIEMSETGSYSAAQTHFAVRKEIVKQDQKLIAKTLNQLIKYVAVINFGVDFPVPKFVLIEEQELQKERADRDEKLTRIGVKFNKTYYENEYHLNPAHFDLTDPQNGDAGTQFNFPEDADDTGIPSDETLAGQAQALVSTVFDLAEESKNFTEFREKMDAVFPELKAQKFAEKFAEKWAIARLWGEAENAPGNS